MGADLLSRSLTGKSADKLSNQLDGMADTENPIEIDVRKNSIYSKALLADPDKAFREKQIKAVDEWNKMVSKLNEILGAKRINWQDLRSTILLLKGTVQQKMSSVAYVAVGVEEETWSLNGGRESQNKFDQEQLQYLQSAHARALAQMSEYANDMDQQGVVASLQEASRVFEEWRTARLGGDGRR